MGPLIVQRLGLLVTKNEKMDIKSSYFTIGIQIRLKRHVYIQMEHFSPNVDNSRFVDLSQGRFPP